jgi:hypothetical protein
MHKITPTHEKVSELLLKKNNTTTSTNISIYFTGFFFLIEKIMT